MNIKNIYISSENKAKEKQVFQKILQCINTKKSMVFDAGAGAGKTYSLIQSLKYIINKYGKILKENNQKVLCITYTNVAVCEIKERLGSTSLIEVSTIHDCLWRIIEPYQKQLVKIHCDKLQNEIYIIEKLLESEKWAEKYRDLSEDEKNFFFKIINENKEEYFKHRNDKAILFKSSLPQISNNYPNLISNVSNFKKVVNAILKIMKYKKALKKIKANKSKFNKVIYDARFNHDNLQSMKISHDTLLEYTEKIVKESDLLKQIICDKYPFVLVDEYQDTDPKVINTLSLLDEFAKKIQHDFFVGYYGDLKQNIYSTGVGSDFYNIHKGLERIIKTFNRRSSIEIISIANKIRNDDIKQQSIYNNFPKGSVSFYNINIDREKFINAHIKKWNITKENKLHCFELTNELVAQYSGFPNIYNFFKNASWYNLGQNYKLLPEHILSLDVRKLGVVQNLLFRILDFKFRVNQNKEMVSDIFSKSVINHINILELRKLIEKFRKVEGQTLKSYIKNLFLQYNNGDDKYDKCLEYIIGEEIKSYADVEDFLLNQLYFFNEQEQYLDDYIEESRHSVTRFLEINIKEFNLWYKFIINNNENKIVYHTYHGTKGLEFKNVIIFMKSKFGRDKDYFIRLLKVLGVKDDMVKRVDKTDKIEEARNLFYVAVTRAIINLSILYLDDVGDAKEQVEYVFGKIKYNI